MSTNPRSNFVKKNKKITMSGELPFPFYPPPPSNPCDFVPRTCGVARLDTRIDFRIAKEKSCLIHFKIMWDNVFNLSLTLFEK